MGDTSITTAGGPAWLPLPTTFESSNVSTNAHQIQCVFIVMELELIAN